MSRGLAAGFGDRVNVYPVKGYSITVNLPEQADQDAAPWVSLLDDKAKIVTSRLGPTRFRMAALRSSTATTATSALPASPRWSPGAGRISRG